MSAGSGTVSRFIEVFQDLGSASELLRGQVSMFSHGPKCCCLWTSAATTLSRHSHRQCEHMVGELAHWLATDSSIR